jgi:hypothetical protein
MGDNDLEETLQTLAPVFYHIVAEAVCKDLARQRRYCDPGRFALQHVSKVLKVGIAPTDGGVLELKGRDICYNVDFVIGIHVSAGAVGSRVPDLLTELCISQCCRRAAVTGMSGEVVDTETRILLSQGCSLGVHRSLHSSAVEPRATT